MTAVDTPEKILFASTTQAFLQKEAPLGRVRELHAAGESFDPAWWRRAAELGWTALLVPEGLGGGSVSGQRGDTRTVVPGQRRARGTRRLRRPGIARCHHRVAGRR